MAEESERGGPNRHASWVGLRTLRQRPTVVGQTAEGQTVYEVDSVQLLLSPGSSRFRRLVPCLKCDRDVAGSPVLGSADLDRPATPVFCDHCSRTGAPAAPLPVTPALAPEPAVEVEAAPPPDHRRLSALEAQLAAVMAKLRAPTVADGQLASLTTSVVQAAADIRELALAHDALNGKIAELAERVDLQFMETRAGMAAMVDAQRQQMEAALTGGLDRVRAEVGFLEQKVHEQPESVAEPLRDLTRAREEIERRLDALTASADATASRQHVLEAELGGSVADAHTQIRELVRVHSELDQRILDLAERDVQPSTDGVEAAVARTLADARERTIAMIDAERQQANAALVEGLDRVRAEIASLEQQLHGQSAALNSVVESERDRLTTALRDVAQQTLAAVSEPLRDLTRARGEIERRLQALDAAVDAGSSRQHALEQKLHESIERITRLLDPRAKEPPPGERPRRGSILESLEQQLQAAEERLAQR